MLLTMLAKLTFGFTVLYKRWRKGGMIGANSFAQLNCF